MSVVRSSRRKEESSAYVRPLEIDGAYDTGSGEEFDRMEFAMRVLRILRPVATTVVLYERHHGVNVERGADLSRRRGSKYAIVGISARASRAYIALALAEVAGGAGAPFLVDLLVKSAAVRTDRNDADGSGREEEEQEEEEKEEVETRAT